MSEKKKYDTTLARMAGNIAAGLVAQGYRTESVIAIKSVAIARRIVAELTTSEDSSVAAEGQTDQDIVWLDRLTTR